MREMEGASASQPLTSAMQLCDHYFLASPPAAQLTISRERWCVACVSGPDTLHQLICFLTNKSVWTNSVQKINLQYFQLSLIIFLDSNGCLKEKSEFLVSNAGPTFAPCVCLCLFRLQHPFSHLDILPIHPNITTDSRCVHS